MTKASPSLASSGQATGFAPRDINGRALLLLCAGLIGLGTGTHFLHAYQVRKNAAGLLAEAGRAEAADDIEEAETSLHEYVGLMPKDPEGWARYGQLLAGKKPPDQRQRGLALYKALNAFDKSLLWAPDRDDIRRAAAEAALQIGRFQEASDHLKDLAKKQKPDADFLLLEAQCAEGLRQYEEAADKYDKALHEYGKALRKAKEKENYLVAALGAARVSLHLKPPQTAKADKIIRELVDRLPRELDVRREAGRYYWNRAQWPQALEQAAFVVDQLPATNEREVLFAADTAQRAGNLKESKRLLESGLQRDPESRRLKFALVQVALLQEDLSQAQRIARQLLADVPATVADRVDLANLLLDTGLADEGRKLIQGIPEDNDSPALRFARARLAAHDGRWGQARQLMEDLPPDYRTSGPSVLINLLLAQCYAQLGNPDQQLVCLRRALRDRPESMPLKTRARLQMQVGAVLMNLGKLREAQDAYERIRQQKPEIRLQVARILFQRNERLPEGERRWNRVEKILADLPADWQERAPVQLLKASVQLATGQAAQARHVLEQRARAHPKDQTWSLAIAQLLEREGQREAARRQLEASGRKFGHTAQWQTVWLAFWTHEGGKESLRQIHELEKSPDARRALSDVVLADAYRDLGDRASAVRLWRKIAQVERDNVPVHMRLFEQALADNDASEMDHWLAELSRIEGAGGAFGHYATAARLLASAKPGQRSDLEDAQRHAIAALTARPNWPAAAVLAAKTYELAGQTEQALKYYRQALDLGEKRVAVVERVVNLLSALHRYEEARDVLANLPEQARTQVDLGRKYVELSLLVRQRQRAPSRGQAAREIYKAALRAVAPESKNYRDCLWLGQVALAAGQRADAEQHLRRATQLAPERPEVWVVLTACMRETDARKVNETVEAAIKHVPGDQRLITEAQCWDAAGQMQKASASFAASLKAQPQSLDVRHAAGRFYVRTGQSAAAVPVLRSLVADDAKSPPDVRAWASRELAILLAGSGSYAGYREALALLNKNKEPSQDTIADRRAHARVLACHPSSRAEAIAELESLDSGDALEPGDRFVLARLYDTAGASAKAKEQYLRLLAQPEPQLEWVHACVAHALKDQNWQSAELWLDRLDKSTCPAAPTVALRIRLLHGQRRDQDAVDLAKRFVHSHPDSQGALARLLEEIGQVDWAEKYYRAAAADPKRRETALALATFLGRQKRTDQALDLCDRLRSDIPTHIIAAVALEVVSASDRPAALVARVENWLKEALNKQPGNITLLVLAAQAAELHEHYPQAAQLYEQILTEDPKNIIALNNLAWYLSFQPGQAERALKLVNQAIDQVGPIAELLDTRGVALLSQGDAERAVADLQQAVAERPDRPVYYFHLARAYAQAGQRPKAHDVFAKAQKELHLSLRMLHPLERRTYLSFPSQFNAG